MTAVADQAVADLLGERQPAPSRNVGAQVVDQLLGPPEATRTHGGAVVSIGGRSQMTPRQAESEGYTVDDLMREVGIANADASSGPTVAGMSTLTRAAMVDDPATKLRIFAQARFPDDPGAENRYGWFNGEVVYEHNGKLFRDTPAGFTGGLKEFGAGLAGKALPIAGGAVGGALGAAGGPPGIVGGAALGAAAGEGYRKAVANVALDEPQTVGGNVKAMGTEAAWAGGGAYVGKLLGDFLNRHAARDITKLDRPAAHELQAKARRFDIELTPGQASNLPSQKLREEALARMPASADIMDDAMRRQATQASNAAERFLATISKVDGLDEAGTQAREAAKTVIAQLTAERANAARPLYQQAFSSFAGFSDDQGALLARLRTSPSFKEAERLAQRLYSDDLATMGAKQMPQASALRDLHYTKLALDKLIGDSATGAYNKTTRSALIGIKNQLLSIMDDAAPAYAQARATFAHMSPNIESVKEGVISRVAGLGDEQSMKAAQMLLGPQMSPTAVQRARTLFEKAGLGDDWNAVVRAHLQESFMKAGREFKTGGGAVGQAPSFRAAMVGDPAQRRVLEAAMNHQQRAAFNDLMEVFEAMGRIRPATANSITRPMEEAVQVMRRESGAGVIGKGAQLLSPQDIGSRISQWLAEARAGQHAEKLAELVASPDGLRKLRSLQQLEPGTLKHMMQASAVFGISIAPNRTDSADQ